MKSCRRQFRQALSRQRQERLLFVSRLDFWHADAARNNSLPPECEGLSIPQIESMLGMGRSARFRGFQRVEFPGAEKAETHDGNARATTLSLGGRTLRETVVRTAEEKLLGIRGHTTEYFLKTEEDYGLMAELWERAAWRTDHAGFAAFDRATSDDGLPMIILGSTPADMIMIAYAGYENFFLHCADFPGPVSRLRQTMEKRYEEFWPELIKSPAELILHGNHWSTDMTPPGVFRAQILPYARRFAAAMRAAGKYTAFHADADLSGLLPEIAECGMDVADCFACAPLVKLTLAEARRAWKDRLVVWGGLPSTMFLPSCPETTYRRCLENFLAQASNGRAIIAGVSDNLMPGSLWERIKETAGRIAALEPQSA